MKKSENITKQDLVQTINLAVNELKGYTDNKFGELKDYTDNNTNAVLEAINEFANNMEQRFTKVEVGQAFMQKQLINLEMGQDDIQAKLGNVVYRFELVDLTKRVERLESR